MRWFAALLPLACAQAALAQDAEAELRALEQAQVEAAMARDVDRLLDLFEDDVLVLGPGETIDGKAAYARHLEPIRHAYRIEVSRVPERIDISRSGDLATVVGRYANSFSAAIDQPSVSRSGKYVTIYRRGTAGDWKVTADITAPEPQPGVP